MQTFRKRSPLAHQPQGSSESSGHETQSPQQSASAASGAYLRAVNPTEAEAAALARGESLTDGAKIEGLRFELEVGVWRADSDHIARRVIDDAACTAYTDDDDTEDSDTDDE